VLRTPQYVLYPLILGISMVGVYSASGSGFISRCSAGFGLVGYLDAQARLSSAPADPRPRPGRRHGAGCASPDDVGGTFPILVSRDLRRDAGAGVADFLLIPVFNQSMLAPAGAERTNNKEEDPQ